MTDEKMIEISEEEAIQILSTRDAHGVLCGYTSGVTEAIDMGIKALQKSIPKPPKKDKEGNLLCPLCGEDVDWHKYCEECGQAIEW